MILSVVSRCREGTKAQEIVQTKFDFRPVWLKTVLCDRAQGGRVCAKGHVRNDMELYYKDLISEDASLEKLVDDLMLVVQGADAFAEAAGANLDGKPKEEIANRLARLKQSCHRVREQAVAGAVAAYKMLRQYPYSSIGFGFGLGLLVGALLRPKR